MPPPETSDLHQRAVVWESAVEDIPDGTDLGKDGQPLVALEPVEIPCRIVRRQRTMQGPQGNAITVDGTMVTAREVKMESLVWEGAIDEMTGTANAPSDLDGLMVVKAEVAHATDIKNRFMRREYGIMRFRGGALPTES